MSKNFEDYTTLELTKFYENYLEKIPDEFNASKIIITARKHNKVNYHTSYSLKIKINDNIGRKDYMRLRHIRDRRKNVNINFRFC